MFGPCQLGVGVGVPQTYEIAVYGGASSKLYAWIEHEIGSYWLDLSCRVISRMHVALLSKAGSNVGGVASTVIVSTLGEETDAARQCDLDVIVSILFVVYHSTGE